jgi:hypothetical protein
MKNVCWNLVSIQNQEPQKNRLSQGFSTKWHDFPRNL